MPPEIDEQDQNVSDQPLSLRETLEASITQHSDAPAIESAADARARDESGRFAPKAAETAAAPAATPQQAAPAPAPVDAQAQPTQQELTTWRKEMRPLQTKLASGQPLTPDEAKQLADYNVQREREYSTGISTYKSEAQHAKEVNAALQEVMPALQQNNIPPAQWIQNVGRAHMALVYGAPAQKIQMFAQLAQDYGIPLDALQQFIQGGGVNPQAMQGMQQQSQVMQELHGVKQWMNQQQQAATQQELSKFQDAARFPHFEQVRNTMAQLLEAGMANDPEEAYNTAVRMDATAWGAEQQRQAANQASTQQQASQAAVKKARAAGVSIRTGTPVAPASRPATDLRGTLTDAFDQMAGGGRV